eukprot:gene11655-biopygen7873
MHVRMLSAQNCALRPGRTTIHCWPPSGGGGRGTVRARCCDQCRGTSASQPPPGCQPKGVRRGAGETQFWRQCRGPGAVMTCAPGLRGHGLCIQPPRATWRAGCRRRPGAGVGAAPMQPTRTRTGAGQ